MGGFRGFLAAALVLAVGCGRKPAAAPDGTAAVREARDGGGAAAPAQDAVPPPPPPLDPAVAADPFVRALVDPSAGGGVEEALLPALVAAAAGAPGAAFDPPSLVRDAGGLRTLWTARIHPTSGDCTTLVPRLRSVLTEAGYAETPRAGGLTGFERTGEGGLRRSAAFECLDASVHEAPGCTGGSCRQPLAVRFEVILAVPAPPFATPAEALAPFPALAAALRATLLPPFLEQRLASAPLTRLFCERWDGTSCQWDLAFELVPAEDPAGWIRGTIELARRHGFFCDQSYKDPARDDVASLQACSGRNLWYRLREGKVSVRLAAVVGAAVEGTPVDCSARYAAEHADDPPPAADPEVETVFEVPVRKRVLAETERLHGCWLRHRQAAGDAPQGGGWRRLGAYLERTAYVAGGPEVTWGLQHLPGAPEPVQGFHWRGTTPVGPDMRVELYAERADAAVPGGRLQATIKGPDGTDLVLLALHAAELAPTLASPEALAARLVRAVDERFERSLHGIGRRQDCRVLPNAAQECDWVETTEVEQAAARNRLEADRDRDRALLTERAADLLAGLSDFYPFTDPACDPFAAPEAAP